MKQYRIRYIMQRCEDSENKSFLRKHAFWFLPFCFFVLFFFKHICSTRFWAPIIGYVKFDWNFPYLLLRLFTMGWDLSELCKNSRSEILIPSSAHCPALPSLEECRNTHANGFSINSETGTKSSYLISCVFQSPGHSETQPVTPNMSS